MLRSSISFVLVLLLALLGSVVRLVYAMHDVRASNAISSAATTTSVTTATPPGVCRENPRLLAVEVINQLVKSRHVLPLRSLCLLLDRCPWLLWRHIRRPLSLLLVPRVCIPGSLIRGSSIRGSSRPGPLYPSVRSYGCFTRSSPDVTFLVPGMTMSHHDGERPSSTAGTGRGCHTPAGPGLGVFVLDDRGRSPPCVGHMGVSPRKLQRPQVRWRRSTRRLREFFR